ncbi:type II and III secretion system protein family protein [Pasteurella testudinis]|uniref:type II and III secretion system protein family protein n=1 Tax=Pasteurella testudinis TaxID=761 RepID=UPI0040590F34
MGFKKYNKKAAKPFFLFSLLMSVGFSALAAQFTLEAGQTKTIKSAVKIDTIFGSNPEIADYEILDDYSYIIYAKSEGKAEVGAYNEAGEVINKDTITVNALLTSINELNDTNAQIRARFPKSKLSVQQVGKAYLIEGDADSEVEREEINRVVGEALGADKTVRKVEIKYNGEKEEVPFLERVDYSGVVNHSQTSDTAQINVKLSVVEVNKDFSESIGINWSNLSGSVIGGFTGLTTNANTARGGYYGKINANSFNAFINALNNQSNARILAEPNVSMISGETASLLVGGQIPFASKDKDGTTITYKDFGVQLAVGAKIQKNNRIRMILGQEVSTIAGSYNYEVGNVPYFNTRRSKSTIELADGESFILGGLLSSEDIEGINKLPVLGDIPILGAFFRNATTERRNKELVIIATVNTVRPVSRDQIEYPTFERTGTLERFFNVTPMKETFQKTLATNFLERGGFIQ